MGKQYGSQSMIAPLQGAGKVTRRGFYVTCDKDKKTSATYRASKTINEQIRMDFRGEFTNGENAGLDDEGYAQL